ncbi:efflux RND transporter periplasmic adaptor subunit [Chryseobacterium shandongense]|uniref:efflux RND transporter periplasmic adaptor subunit n=1 Tax=Chryseobacterium shandongense TaxID=1493872 RepID=UPI000F4DBD8B|nr:efflux RND transporter periplasmic adaptor subunit [Chryseobacterium shandongense]AZA56523.1 efflux RND transporter periplasmic adaptor subunit [Chryseobacterium shandongense]
MSKASFWVLMFVLMFVGCKQNATQEHGQEHEAGGLEPLAYTLYSEKSELFVEFKPLVVGSTSKFATHLTILGDEFKALNEAKVTVSLIVGEDGIRASVDSASSPGIFRLALSPKKAGKGKLVFDIVTKDYTDQIVINDITVYPNDREVLKNQVHEANSNEISYLKEQAWKVPFANMEVQPTDYHTVIKTSGMVVPAPGDEAVVAAKSDGIVKFTNNNLTVGLPIRAGTSMFSISGGGVAQGNIDATVQQARATYNQAKANYERAKELVKDQIVSQREFLDAKVAFENAQTAYNMVGKNYNSGSGQSNTASISGFISSILVTDGQFVTAGTPLAIISKNQRLLLQANVSQKYFNVLPSIASANFKIAGSDAVLNTQDLNGKVVSFGRNAAAQGGFLPLLFEVDNSTSIVPGTAVEFFLKSTAIPNAIVIPVSALIDEQGNFFVYVQTGGESFEKKAVTLGENDGEIVQVLNGLKVGERVVTKGAYQIKLSAASGTMPAHGHEH